jgi:flagella basal body P-ring formation protein FlgA
LDEAATAKSLFVRNGQKIVLLFRSETFVLGSDATALGDASEGATVRVRTLSGKIVEGTAIAAGQVQAK